VADETLDAIDRIYDFLDKGVDTANRVFGRGERLEQRLKADQQTRRAKREGKPEIIDAKATVKKAAPSTTAVVRKVHFYIMEATDPKSGDTIFVVTDGKNARTECSTREFANQILSALAKGVP